MTEKNVTGMETIAELRKRVEQFHALELPGQPMMMHMGTSYLISDLLAEVSRLTGELAMAKSEYAGFEEFENLKAENDRLTAALAEAEQTILDNEATVAHSDAFREALDETKKALSESTAREIAARESERERCAKVVEKLAHGEWWFAVAAAIRSQP